MTTAKRISKTPASGPRIALFKIWKTPIKKDLQLHFESIALFFVDSANFDERFLSAYLTLLAQGQISPHSLPSLKPVKEAD